MEFFLSDQTKEALAKYRELSQKIVLWLQPLMEFQKRLEEVIKPIRDNLNKSTEVLRGISIFSNIIRANDALIDLQFVFTDYLSSKISEEILDALSIEAWVDNYYFENSEERFCKLLNRCKAHLQTETERRLLCECEQAYINQSYHLACIGLFSLTDGVLSEITESNQTSVAKRLNIINDKIVTNTTLDEYDARFFCIFQAMYRVSEDNDKSIIKCRELFESSDFNGLEPKYLNRHWTIHGRTERIFNRLDVLRILQWIDGLFYIVSPNNQEN